MIVMVVSKKSIKQKRKKVIEKIRNKQIGIDRALSYYVDDMIKRNDEFDRIRNKIIADGAERVINIYDDVLLEATIENPCLYDLRRNTNFCVLHGSSFSLAIDSIQVYLKWVYESRTPKCFGIIHGKGLHSMDIELPDHYKNYCEFENFGDLTDHYNDGELKPILKPLIRYYLDEMPAKFNCYSIYGENLFKTEQSKNNFGIAYFMNKQYHEFFYTSGTKWNSRKITAFQELSKNDIYK